MSPLSGVSFISVFLYLTTSQEVYTVKVISVSVNRTSCCHPRLLPSDIMHRSSYDRSDRYGNGSDHDEAPHSRLFILCGKDVTEEDLRKGFSPFGKIVKVKCVEDRNSGDRKGIVCLVVWVCHNQWLTFCLIPHNNTKIREKELFSLIFAG